jgi:Ca2+-binding EF-hand superfamily protein
VKLDTLVLLVQMCEAREMERSKRTAANDVRAIFDGFDRDRSGFIDLREFARVLEAMGLEPDDEQVQVLLRKADADGSGRLSWNEFSAWFDEL